MKKRKLDVVVVSDVHLGTFGCRASELLKYLKSINTKTLILNGDIIDIWQFNKRYFPKPHMKVIKHLTSLIASGTKVYYITGNHDEMLRKFNGFQLGSFQIVNKLVLELDGKTSWFFHGDVFDVTMKHSKWLAKLGGVGYDMLIIINTVINKISYRLGYGKISLSKKIKNSVKGAVKFINNFESVAAEMAMYKKYDHVVCGHIHQPEIKVIRNKEGKEVTYLNSGDWIENLTALEYKKGKWSLYEFNHDHTLHNNTPKNVEEHDLDDADEMNTSQLFEDLLKEFDITR